MVNLKINQNSNKNYVQFDLRNWNKVCNVWNQSWFEFRLLRNYIMVVFSTWNRDKRKLKFRFKILTWGKNEQFPEYPCDQIFSEIFPMNQPVLLWYNRSTLDEIEINSVYFIIDDIY